MTNLLAWLGGDRDITVNQQNYHLLNSQKDKINIFHEKINNLYEQFEKDRETYLKYLETIENDNIKKINSIEFIEKYNNLISIFCELLYIKSEFKNIKKINSNDLNIKEENSKIILKNLNEFNVIIEEKIIYLDKTLKYFFNKINLVLAKKIENNDLNLDQLFSSISKLDDKTVKTLIEENNSGNNRLTPYYFIINNKDKLFELTNYLENIQKTYDLYTEVDKRINDSDSDNLNYTFSEKHNELLSITLKKNFKFLFNKILGNPNLSNEEKVDKIENIFRENIENNYLYVFRGKAGEIFEEIFKYNYLGKNIFERLIFKEKQDGINKNIRLTFIKNYKNLDEILKYLYNPFQEEEQEEINIKLGTRSTIAILKRLEKEKNITKDIDKKSKYNDYYIYFKEVLIEKYFKNKSDLNSESPYNKNKNIENIRLIEDYLPIEDIKKLQEDVSKKIKTTIDIKETINTVDKKPKTIEEKINSSDLISMIKNGIGYVTIIDLLENGKIIGSKGGWKKQIALAILENNNAFIIKLLLKNDFFSELNKENMISNFIKKSDNLIKKLEILNITDFNFNKKEILKTLISKNSSYQDFINILGNKYFKDVNLKLYNEDGSINNEDTEIFLNIFFKSTNEELAIQGIGMMNNYTEQLIRESIYISPNKKKYTLSKDGKIIFKLNRLF